jgi:hypothetical protein
MKYEYQWNDLNNYLRLFLSNNSYIIEVAFESLIIGLIILIIIIKWGRSGERKGWEDWEEREDKWRNDWTIQ